MDLVIVPTIEFRLLCCLVIVDRAWQQMVDYAGMQVLMTEWVARQIVEALPWDEEQLCDLTFSPKAAVASVVRNVRLVSETGVFTSISPAASKSRCQ